jgi:preprotein translocase subunit SecA
MYQRGHAFAIVDEVDSILIDEARTPLIISAPARTARTSTAVDKLMPRAGRSTTTLDEKQRICTYTEDGQRVRRGEAARAGLLPEGHALRPRNRRRWSTTSTRRCARTMLFKRDKDYIVRDNEVVLIDEFTGRMMSGRRLSDGLHQAIEAKEGVRSSPRT